VTTTEPDTTPTTQKDPLPALWALVLGFFMIMVDTTIYLVGLTKGWWSDRGQPIDVPAERRFSHASTTRAAMPASAALPHARGS
jgi:hypothetical protein